MGLLDKLMHKPSDSSSADTSFPPAPPTQPLGPNDIPRYRKQRGVNFGSWFVLERWICPQVFQGAVPPGKSDFDVARGGNAKQVLEPHWDSWIKDEDWRWIKERGFNSVRIPIAYYHLCGACPGVLEGTDFEPFHDVFEGAYGRFTQAISTAQKYGLGVLVDLHAAAGAQNADAHAGMSNGKASLFSSSANLRSTSLALRFLASTLCHNPNVIGLELLNEPANNGKLQKWYETTLAEVRAVAGPDFPIYVSDAWDTHHYASWVGGRDDFVVLDHHLYRCFTDQDKTMNGDQHAQKLRNEFAGTFGGQSSAAKGNLVVGEWSASLDPRSLHQGMPDGEKDRQRREFVKAELELFERGTAGWWFWTYKKGEGWDAGWSARDASRAEILPSWVGSGKFRGPSDGSVKARELQSAHGAHTSYWQSHGGSPDPAVFAPGFAQGWDDALIFFSDPSGSSEMGFVSQWARRRKADYEAGGRKLGRAAWEWEHGFAEGVQACKTASLQ